MADQTDLGLHAIRRTEELKTRRKKINRLFNPTFGPEFWNEQAELSKAASEEAESRGRLEWSEHWKHYNCSFPRWMMVEDFWAALLRRQHAHFQLQVVAARQAERLTRELEGSVDKVSRWRRPRCKAFFNLHIAPRLPGSKVEMKDDEEDRWRNTGSRALCDTNDHGQRRQAMQYIYSARDRDLSSWDPVLGAWGGGTSAVYLFPCKSVEIMDTVFGRFSREEVSSPSNGLFLSQRIEEAVDVGVLTFVPDIDESQPLGPRDEVREYKSIVLESGAMDVNAKIFGGEGAGVTSLAELHNRRLTFKTDFRPQSRYMFWAFLSAIVKASCRQQQNPDLKVTDDIIKATGCWAAAGQLITENILLGFAEQLGHNAGDILKNAIKNVEREPRFDICRGRFRGNPVGPDFTGVLFDAAEAVAKAEELINEHDSDDEDSSEDEE